MNKHYVLIRADWFLSGRWVVWLLLWLLALPALGQTIRYVRVDGTGNGSSWAQASPDLQAMINASGATNQVWVAGGTYKPGGNANTDRSISFSMKSGVAIYGGFVGTETTLSERPASVTLGQPSSTTLSGDLGIIGTTTDNSYHIISNSNVSKTALLDGVLLAAASPESLEGTGGGIRNINSSPIVRNCYFMKNSGLYGSNGGGFYSDATSQPLIDNCTFTGNFAGNGGAISSTGSLTVTNSSFTNNSGFGTGAVVASTIIMTNCSFNNNTASSTNGGAGFGGAAQVGSGSVLTNCLFVSNFTTGNGGALSIGDNVTINRCTFRANAVYSGGAGVPNASGGAIFGGGVNSIISNCSFSGNHAGARGTGAGGVAASSNATFINCSFGNNSADHVGGALAGGSPNLLNCIIWGNRIIVDNSLNGISSSTSAALTYTDTQDGTPGTGNISVDPLFVDAPGDNLRLRACSPAIDKGDNSGSVGTTDVVGNPRRVRSIDMGAYEFQGTPLTPVAITSTFQRAYSIPQGGSLTVSVSTTGSVSGYQWYKDGVALTGNASATTPTLTLSPLTPADAGDYYVVVSGGCNSVTSTTFRLLVNTGMYTVKSGSWDDPTVWALNRLPVSSDAVRLKHVVTIPAGYIAHARRVSYDTGQRLRVGAGGRLRLNH